MELFNVYSLYPIEPVRGKGCYVYDAAGRMRSEQAGSTEAYDRPWKRF